MFLFVDNNETYYDQILTKASKYLSRMQFDILKLSLSIRSHSPAVEMSRKVRILLLLLIY
jgi:hypothetical protein